MNERNREELARRLLDQPPESWPEELRGLRAELRVMPASLRSRLAAMSKEKPPAFRFRWPVAAAVSLSGAIAAAVLVYPVFFQRTEAPPMTIAFAEGEVKLDGKPVNSGVMHAGQQITTGPGSIAVLSSDDGHTENRIRVLADSRLALKVSGAQRLESTLLHGAVFTHVTRRDGPVRAFAISSANAEALVSGTVFSVDVNARSDTALTTFEGTVLFRRRWADLENLPETLLRQTELLAKSRDVFVRASASVGAGSQAVVPEGDFQRRLELVGRLREVLSDPRLAGLRGRSDVSDSEIQAARDFIDSVFPGPAERAESLRRVESAFGQPPGVTRRPDDEMGAMRESLEQLSESERNARFKELLARNPAADRETFRRAAASALGKRPQEILLKNGETLFGSVFGLNGQYQVYTAQGIRLLDPEQIEEIRFE